MLERVFVKVWEVGRVWARRSSKSFAASTFEKSQTAIGCSSGPLGQRVESSEAELLAIVLRRIAWKVRREIYYHEITWLASSFHNHVIQHKSCIEKDYTQSHAELITMVN